MENSKGQHGGSEVSVSVNAHEYLLHRGSWVVFELKRAVGVAADRELDEVVDGEFRPLLDDERVTLKGGEVFVSHVRQGASS